MCREIRHNRGFRGSGYTALLDTTALHTRVAIKALGLVMSPLERPATKVKSPA
jgi:hypothetical protein